VFVFEELTRNQKGALAEAAIELAAIRAGIAVYRPTSGHSRADMIFEIGAQLGRVQVKWGNLSSDGNTVTARLSTATNSPLGGYVTRTYSADEVDVFAIHCAVLERSFLVPIDVANRTHAIQLRLSPPRNNQRACINLADDFDFEGAIAQLGERLAGSQKVRGSSPLSSIDSPPAAGPALTVGCNRFRDGFGDWIDRVANGQEVVITRRGRPRIRMTPV
jgi:prevent-host-death family protein